MRHRQSLYDLPTGPTVLSVSVIATVGLFQVFLSRAAAAAPVSWLRLPWRTASTPVRIRVGRRARLHRRIVTGFHEAGRRLSAAAS